MVEKNFTRLNAIIGFVANNEVVGSSKMEFFKPDGSPTDYVDIEISEIQEKLTAMLAAVEGTEMRHLLIIVDNLKNMIEASALQGGNAVATLIMEAVDMTIPEKERAITSVRDYFNHLEDEDEASQMLNQFLAKGKPN